MTVIIGIRCREGLALVSDTKIVDTESGNASYESKILTPLRGTAFVAGAAGYTDLFREFNRKVPLFVNQRLAEYQIKNVKALIRTGLSRDEAIEYLRVRASRTEQSAQPVDLRESAQPEARRIADVTLPYVYSMENFMDDCKAVINQITAQVESEPSPLQVLIGMHRDVEQGATLHFINSLGRERQIDRFYAIGSGSTHVAAFFDRLYDFNKPLLELINLAFFTIGYIQKIAHDPYVGYTTENPPEAIVVLNDARYGKINIANMIEILDNIDRLTREFDAQIHSLTFPVLRGPPQVAPPST